MSTAEGAKEFLKTKVGQEAIEAESQVAFDLGMYTMHRHIYPVLNFDPLVMSLPVIYEDPDPDAKCQETGDVAATNAVDGDAADSGMSHLSDLPLNTSVSHASMEDILIEDITGAKDA